MYAKLTYIKKIEEWCNVKNNKNANNKIRSNIEPHNVTYYDETYFEFQKAIGEFSGWAETPKFVSYISPYDTVIDFGCGGGYILKNINCAKKIGVEINDVARSFAEKNNGILAVKFVEDLEDSVADVIISNHALEHCFSPREELVNLLKKVKPGGRVIFFVPHECIANKWFPSDVNKHLYTWNPMTLGNLFLSAGYEIESVRPFYHIWPPFYLRIAKLGQRIFHLLSFISGFLRKKNSQVKIVARRSIA